MSYKNISIFACFVLLMGSCTKLDENLGNNFTNEQTSEGLGAAGTGLILQGAYADLAAPFNNQDRVFSLEQCTSDESLVPTRGGDWDDNGAWRVLHNHTWNADHDQFLQTFNLLNKINFDATNVLAFNPSAAQAAEARFLRAYSLYYLLDLYGQFPFRNPGDNLLNAPEVLSGEEAANFIINELTEILPDLSTNNTAAQANPEAAKTLLMKCYLNKGAFLNRAAPTFDAADMQQVITLGQQIIASGKYKYMSNYFDNFNAKNDTSTEAIFIYRNQSGVSANNSGPQARWMMTLHYNSYSGQKPNAGWNGFSTASDFYNSFGATAPTTGTPTDTLLDKRLGGRYYKGLTNYSGIRPGFLIGQQYDEHGVAEKDRKGNPLSFTPVIAPDMIEQGSNLEVTGIRVVKYVPDFTDPSGKFYSSTSGNSIMLMRYPDVVLMVVEAMMRTGNNAGALTLVNDLRAARAAAPLPSITLVNSANLKDPKTLLAERGRELYWESVRRTDLIRFGVFTLPWQYKPTDDAHYLLFPIPTQSLAANPNLTQNPGY